MKKIINYYKGYLKSCYSKENLKYSIPLILCLAFVTYAPVIRWFLREKVYFADGIPHLKKKSKKSDFENVMEYVENNIPDEYINE